MRIYFDNASTTPLLPEVFNYMHEVNSLIYGNPSSIHFFGRQAKIIVEDARKILAEGLGASTGEIFFTSGATEANNMALYCSVRDLGIQTIISTKIEHHCNLHMFDYLEANNLASIKYLNVNNEGHIDYDQLDEILCQNNDNVMVSLMHGNNEIGTLNDMERLAEICHNHNVMLHMDSAQTIGKMPIDLSDEKVAFISGSAHKFHGPKGVGFIYINNNNLIKPLFHGGDQERGMRSGTENISGIAGMAKAFELASSEMEDRTKILSELRQYFVQQLQDNFEDIIINGSSSSFLPNILSVSFPPSENVDMLMMNLDISGICASSGSACSSGVENDSHVLEEIGHDTKRKTVRFSFSHLNTKKEVDYVIRKLHKLTPERIS
ncbi:MAG: cysteine desulfurase [Bacteroidia bacterium]|nr:cysteine desulfurase [Bacteroidia bacterium]